MPSDEHRRAGIFAAVHWVVVAVWAGLGESESAGIRRAFAFSAGPGRAALVGQFPAGRLSGDARFQSQRPDCQSEERALFATASAEAARFAPAAQSDASGRAG